MADNTVLNAGSGGDTLRTEDRTTYKTPVSLIDVGGTSAESIIGDSGVTMPVGGLAAHDAAVSGNPILVGAEFDDTLPDSVDEGDIGRLRISANRCLYVNIRDNAGNERGLNVDASGNIGITDASGSLTVDNAHLTSLGGAISGTEVQVDIVGALPAGTNAIGKLAANSGVDIGDVDVTSVIAGTGATNLGKAIDSIAGGTDTGVAVLGVRDDALSALTPIEGDYAPFRVDANGALWVVVNGTVTVGSHAVTNAGTFAVQESGASLTALQLIDDAVYTDGTGTPSKGIAVMGTDGTNPQLIAVDSSGNVQVDLVTANVTNAGTFAVQVDGSALTALQLIDDPVFADDAAFTLASSKVMMVGAIRDDALSTLTAVEGDAVPLRVSSTGALHVTGAGGGTQYNVDDVAGATDTGTLLLAIRDDSLTTLTPADGDYVGLRVSSTGALHVTGGGGGTEYNEDAATPATITGTATMMERDDALATLTPIEGDWAAMRCSSTGALWVAVDGAVTVGSHAVTNAGTFAVQVDGAALTALQLIDDAVYTDGSGTPSKGIAVMGTDGTNPQIIAVDSSGNVQVDLVTANVTNAGTFAVQVDGTALTRLTDIETNTNYGAITGGGVEASALRVTIATDSTGVVSVDDNGASLTVDVPAVATGGATPGKLISAASTNATSVKGSAATLYSLQVFNTNAAARYLKLYNKASAPTVGTDTPVQVYTIPGNTAGAGLVVPIPTCGIAFDTGLALATTTGAADSDTGAVAANEIVVSYSYK